jgi:hypothetical protein
VPSADRVLAIRGVYAEQLVRTNRITGASEVISEGVTPAVREKRPLPTEDLPADETAKLSGRAFPQGGQFYCDLYNGSQWTVRTATVSLNLQDSSGKAVFVDRKYDLHLVLDNGAPPPVKSVFGRLGLHP